MKQRLAFVVELIVNLLLPWLAYRLARPHWSETGALLASALPPLVWSALELARFRRADALSAVVLLGIAASLVAVGLGGSPRMLLMRESLVSGAIGVAFLGTLPLRRPLMFWLTRATMSRRMQGGAELIERLWREQPVFVTLMRRLSIVWGASLTGETALRAWLVWHWPVERFLLVSPIIGYGIFGVLMLWTFWYGRTLRTNLHAAQQAAQHPAQGGHGAI